MGKLAQQGIPGVQYCKVNVEKHRKLTHSSRVRSIPDTRIYHNGRQIAAFVGTRSADSIENLLIRHQSLLVPHPVEVEIPSDSDTPEQAAQGRSTLPPGIELIPVP